jgi:CBS domain-containing protein
MKVKEVMHKGVEWVGPDTPITEIAKLMRKHDVGAIPIGENDRLIGMVTDRDIVCKGLAQDGFDARGATARNGIGNVHRYHTTVTDDRIFLQFDHWICFCQRPYPE